jgi:hypothetical protein
MNSIADRQSSRAAGCCRFVDPYLSCAGRKEGFGPVSKIGYFYVSLVTGGDGRHNHQQIEFELDGIAPRGLAISDLRLTKSPDLKAIVGQSMYMTIHHAYADF